VLGKDVAQCAQAVSFACKIVTLAFDLEVSNSILNCTV